MEKKKRDLLPFMTFLCLVPVAAAFVLSFMNDEISGEYYYIQTAVMRLLSGFAVIGACQFLGERHFYKPAPILYASIAGILGYQLIIGDHDAYLGMSFIDLPNYMYLYTPNLLFPAYFFIAWYISRQQKFRVREYFLLTFLMGLPAVLIFLQGQEGPAVLMFAVYTVTVAFLKKEKRINASWQFLLLPVMVVAVSAIAMGMFTYYGRTLVEVVLTRGKCDPDGAGFTRTFIDSVLKNTPVVGHIDVSLVKEAVDKYYSIWSDYRLVGFMAQWGRLPAAIVVVLTVVIHILTFRMASKIKQSLFARYLALLLSTFLLVQTVLSLMGMTFFASNFYDLPFFTLSIYLIVFNYMSLGIIITLYRRRNNESVVKVIEEKKCETESVSIIALLRNFIDEDEAEPDEFSEEPTFFDKVRSILLGEEAEDEIDKEQKEAIEKMPEEERKEEVRIAEKNETFAEIPHDKDEE